MEKNVYYFVPPNLADWEAALATAIISDRNTDVPKNRSYPIVTFGRTTQAVRSFGGLTIIPDTDVSGVDAKKAAMLILPGSTLYEKDDPTELVPLVRDFLANDIPVAAICGGTLFLAKHGFLDTIPHTSSGAKWLKAHAPQYRGESHYVHAPCVASGNIITANPAGFVEFATEIMKRLEVFPPELLDPIMGSIRNGYLDADPFEG